MIVWDVLHLKLFISADASPLVKSDAMRSNTRDKPDSAVGTLPSLADSVRVWPAAEGLGLVLGEPTPSLTPV